MGVHHCIMTSVHWVKHLLTTEHYISKVTLRMCKKLQLGATAISKQSRILDGCQFNCATFSLDVERK